MFIYLFAKVVNSSREACVTSHVMAEVVPVLSEFPVPGIFVPHKFRASLRFNLY
jgi:hypothetical protein